MAVNTIVVTLIIKMPAIETFDTIAVTPHVSELGECRGSQGSVCLLHPNGEYDFCERIWHILLNSGH